MALSTLGVINTANEIAYLAGIFNWQIEGGSYTNPNSTATVSFHVINNFGIPIGQYLAGAVNTFNLITDTLGVNKQKDPNLNLFNTQIVSGNIKENITRKYAVNRIPFANYDQLVDLGTGNQKMSIGIIFSGTMYKTAYQNFIQCAFGSESGLGTLNHPFYKKVLNVLPIEFTTTFSYETLSCVICELTVLTSDLTHLVPNAQSEGTLATIQKYYIGAQNAITSIGGTISSAKALSTQAGAIF